MKTNIWQKILPSVINVVIVFVIGSPVWFFDFNITTKKLLTIFIFLIYNLLFLIFNKSRDLGMIVVGTHWQKDYSYLP